MTVRENSSRLVRELERAGYYDRGVFLGEIPRTEGKFSKRGSREEGWIEEMGSVDGGRIASALASLFHFEGWKEGRGTVRLCGLFRN